MKIWSFWIIQFVFANFIFASLPPSYLPGELKPLQLFSRNFIIKTLNLSPGMALFTGNHRKTDYFTDHYCMVAIATTTQGKTVATSLVDSDCLTQNRVHRGLIANQKMSFLQKNIRRHNHYYALDGFTKYRLESIAKEYYTDHTDVTVRPRRVRHNINRSVDLFSSYLCRKNKDWQSFTMAALIGNRSIKSEKKYLQVFSAQRINCNPYRPGVVRTNRNWSSLEEALKEFPELNNVSKQIQYLRKKQI